MYALFCDFEQVQSRILPLYRSTNRYLNIIVKNPIGGSTMMLPMIDTLIVQPSPLYDIWVVASIVVCKLPPDTLQNKWQKIIVRSSLLSTINTTNSFNSLEEW